MRIHKSQFHYRKNKDIAKLLIKEGIEIFIHNAQWYFLI